MRISDTMLQKLKRDYPEGTRVKLIRMDDPYSRLEPSEEGNVIGVDDIFLTSMQKKSQFLLQIM